MQIPHTICLKILRKYSARFDTQIG